MLVTIHEAGYLMSQSISQHKKCTIQTVHCPHGKLLILNPECYMVLKYFRHYMVNPYKARKISQATAICIMTQRWTFH